MNNNLISVLLTEPNSQINGISFLDASNYFYHYQRIPQKSYQNDYMFNTRGLECTKFQQQCSSCYEKAQMIRKMEDRMRILEQENMSLREQIKPKRKYSKRRLHLQKKFKCQRQDCERVYSSSIALHLHISKKHKFTSINSE